MNTENDFRKILQNELLKRCKQNPAYSLRAFAKSLRVNHAALSQIMNNKRPLSKQMFERLAEGLSLRPEQTTPLLKNWHLNQKVSSHKSENKNEPKQNRGKEFEALKKLDDDAFALTADWYHTVLLEIGRNTKTPFSALTILLSVAHVEAGDIRDGEGTANHSSGVERQFRHPQISYRTFDGQIKTQFLNTKSDLKMRPMSDWENRENGPILLSCDGEKK
jgi:plasmid maintenance system antidote protein VapI